MYHKIKNPETNRYVSINSKKGQSIIYNYISILYGGADFSGADYSGDSFRNYRDSKASSESEEEDDDLADDLADSGVETFINKNITPHPGRKSVSDIVKSSNEDALYFTPLSQKVDKHILQGVTADQIARPDAHRTDCVPGTLLSLGFINENLYRYLSDQSRGKGLSIDYVKNIINVIKQKRETTDITGTWLEIISPLLANHQNRVIFAWFTPPRDQRSAAVPMSHAIGIANKAGNPLLIDTQRSLDDKRLILRDGTDEIENYFKIIYPSIHFDQIQWTAFLYEESLSDDLSNMNLNTMDLDW